MSSGPSSLKRKPALRIVERVAAHAEVGENRVGAVEVMLPHHGRDLAEVRTLEHDAIAELHQPVARDGQRRRVAIQPEHPRLGGA